MPSLTNTVQCCSQHALQKECWQGSASRESLRTTCRQTPHWRGWGACDTQTQPSRAQTQHSHNMSRFHETTGTRASQQMPNWHVNTCSWCQPLCLTSFVSLKVLIDYVLHSSSGFWPFQQALLALTWMHVALQQNTNSASNHHFPPWEPSTQTNIYRTWRAITHRYWSAGAAGLHQSVRQQQRRVGLVSDNTHTKPVSHDNDFWKTMLKQRVEKRGGRGLQQGSLYLQRGRKKVGRDDSRWALPVQDLFNVPVKMHQDQFGHSW